MQDNDNTAGKSSVRRGIYDWIQSVVLAIVLCVLVFIFLFRIVNVDGSSMVPTLRDRDKIVVSRLFYKPKQGDIVVLTKHSFSDTSIVKRIVAVGGQTVDIDFNSGEVIVDGVALDEPYTAEPTYRQIDMDFPVYVDEGCIFVMGDNRNRSTDSRDRRIGVVDERCIIGKLIFRLFPLGKFGRVN